MTIELSNLDHLWDRNSFVKESHLSIDEADKV